MFEFLQQYTHYAPLLIKLKKLTGSIGQHTHSLREHNGHDSAVKSFGAKPKPAVKCEGGFLLGCNVDDV